MSAPADRDHSGPGALPRTSTDVLVVGGGLAGGLCALALRALAPRLRVTLVEAGSGRASRTWCCHASDLAAVAPDAEPPAWFTGLDLVRWPEHAVRFPGYARRLHGEYLCLRGSVLADEVARALSGPGMAHLVGEPVVSLCARAATLRSGVQLTAALVIDARGARPRSDGCGWQKFLGLEVELDDPGSLARVPVLMDATVEQDDGYRFVYTLPLAPGRFLVEDTYFSRTPELRREPLRERVLAYLTRAGARGVRIAREESGVLPMPWREDDHAEAPEEPSSAAHAGRDRPVCVGYRGGFFQPATGYSLGPAVLTATRIAELAASCPLDALSDEVRRALSDLRAAYRPTTRFAHRLNWLAFRAVPGAWLRDLVYAPVYRLPEPTLARFYGGRTSRRDRLALLAAPGRLRGERSPTGLVPPPEAMTTTTLPTGGDAA